MIMCLGVTVMPLTIKIPQHLLSVSAIVSLWAANQELQTSTGPRRCMLS